MIPDIERCCKTFLAYIGWHGHWTVDTDDIWFQQDDARAHTAAETIDLVKARFPERLNSIKGDTEWPAKSCDLTPLDFFLWGS